MAEVAPTLAEKQEWLTIVVVGAGPTGVEIAGQIRELASRSLRGEFRTFDPADVRVLLVDGGKEPLATFGHRLSEAAARQLRNVGVELMMGARVVNVDASRRRRHRGATARSTSPRTPWCGPRACRRRRSRRSSRRRPAPRSTTPGTSRAPRPHAARPSRGVRGRRHGDARQAARGRRGRDARQPARGEHDRAVVSGATTRRPPLPLPRPRERRHHRPLPRGLQLLAVPA